MNNDELLQRIFSIVFGVCALGLLIWGIVELVHDQQAPGITRSLMGAALLISAREIRRAK